MYNNDVGKKEGRTMLGYPLYQSGDRVRFKKQGIKNGIVFKVYPYGKPNHKYILYEIHCLEDDQIHEVSETMIIPCPLEITPDTSYQDIKGRLVSFGHYIAMDHARERDRSVGEMIDTAVHWRIIAADASTKRLLLLSEWSVDYAPMESGSYSSSLIRQYLEGNLKDEMFTKAEQEMLAFTTNVTYTYDENEEIWHQETTEDQLFIPAIHDLYNENVAVHIMNHIAEDCLDQIGSNGMQTSVLIYDLYADQKVDEWMFPWWVRTYARQQGIVVDEYGSFDYEDLNTQEVGIRLMTIINLK